MYLEKLVDEVTRSGVMEKVGALVAQIKKNGLSAEQIRDVTEFVKGKVQTLQKKPPEAAKAPVVEEKDGKDE